MGHIKLYYLEVVQTKKQVPNLIRLYKNLELRTSLKCARFIDSEMNCDIEDLGLLLCYAVSAPKHLPTLQRSSRAAQETCLTLNFGAL